MNTAATIAISILAGSAAAVSVTLALQPTESTSEELAVAELQHSVGQLIEQNRLLGERLDTLVG